MNIQQLEYILAVDKLRHFAKAAEYCHVTQPTLSMMIQKLEDELGAKLFDRTSQPIKPTPAGLKVLAQAKIVLHQMAQIKDIVSEEEESLRGTFKLAVLPTIAPYLLPRFLTQLTTRYPDMDLRILEMQTAPTLEALRQGEIDAALIASQPNDPKLKGETLFYEQFFGYVAKGDPLFDKELIRTADISDERLWLLDEGHCFRDQLVKFCNLKSATESKSKYSLGSIETFMRMVESGQGVTFIPELALSQLSDEQKELVRPFALPIPVRDVVLLTTKNFVRHSIANLVVEAIKKHVPQNMLSYNNTEQRI